MKIFLWLMTLAFGVVCLGFWGLSSMILLTFGDQPLPIHNNCAASEWVASHLPDPLIIYR